MANYTIRGGRRKPDALFCGCSLIRLREAKQRQMKTQREELDTAKVIELEKKGEYVFVGRSDE